MFQENCRTAVWVNFPVKYAVFAYKKKTAQFSEVEVRFENYYKNYH